MALIHFSHCRKCEKPARNQALLSLSSSSKSSRKRKQPRTHIELMISLISCTARNIQNASNQTPLSLSSSSNSVQTNPKKEPIREKNSCWAVEKKREEKKLVHGSVSTSSVLLILLSSPFFKVVQAGENISTDKTLLKSRLFLLMRKSNLSSDNFSPHEKRNYGLTKVGQIIKISWKLSLIHFSSSLLTHSLTFTRMKMKMRWENEQS